MLLVDINLSVKASLCLLGKKDILICIELVQFYKKQIAEATVHLSFLQVSREEQVQAGSFCTVYLQVATYVGQVHQVP